MLAHLLYETPLTAPGRPQSKKCGRPAPQLTLKHEEFLSIRKTKNDVFKIVSPHRGTQTQLQALDCLFNEFAKASIQPLSTLFLVF